MVSTPTQGFFIAVVWQTLMLLGLINGKAQKELIETESFSETNEYVRLSQTYSQNNSYYATI